MYKNYIFNLYGTLIDLYTDEKNDDFWYKMSLFFSYNGAHYEEEELKIRYLNLVSKKIEKRLEKTVYPDVRIIRIIRKLYKEKGVIAKKSLLMETMKIFRILSTESVELYSGVVDILEKLKKNNKKIYILSNGQAEFSIPELKYLGIYDYFDGLYFSSDYYTCKPDIKLYKELIKKEKLSIDESVLIGNDYRMDIDCATELNLDYVYLRTNHSPKYTKEIESTYSFLNNNFRILNEIIEEEQEIEEELSKPINELENEI